MPSSTRTKSSCSVHKIVISTIFSFSFFFTGFSNSQALKKTKALTDREATHIDIKYLKPEQRLESSYLKFSIQILLPTDSHLYNLLHFPKEPGRTTYCFLHLLDSFNIKVFVSLTLLLPLSYRLFQMVNLLITIFTLSFQVLLSLKTSHIPQYIKNKTTNRAKFAFPVLPLFCNLIPLFKMYLEHFH